VQFASIQSIATTLESSRGKPDDLSGVLRGNVHIARGGRGREEVTPELLAARIREIGQIVSRHDTGIGGAPTVDVYPGDGGSIGWGSLADEHGGIPCIEEGEYCTVLLLPRAGGGDGEIGRGLIRAAVDLNPIPAAIDNVQIASRIELH